MQFEDAEILRRNWGQNDCIHPVTEKEYFLGNASGDYVCTTCGKILTDKEIRNKEDIEE